MSKMYRAWCNGDIEEVEVVKRTKHFITIQDSHPDGRIFTMKWKIDSQEMKFFDTWLEAKNYLIGRFQQRIESHERSAHELRMKLQQVRLMEAP